MKLFPVLLVVLGGTVKAAAPALGFEAVVFCCFSEPDLCVYERLLAQRAA